MGQIEPVDANAKDLALPTRGLPSAHSSKHPAARADICCGGEERSPSSLLALDVAVAAATLLIALPICYTRIVTAQACPCYASAAGAAAHPGACSSWLRPWLVASFPCGQSKPRQLAWWAQHWVPALRLVVAEGGDWDGAWVQLGSLALLITAAACGPTAKYHWCRTAVAVAIRLGVVLLALLGMAVNTWVAPGALPLAGVHFDRNTMWGATRLLWSTQLHPVPMRHHMWLAPIEFLGTTTCALLARNAHPNPATVPGTLLQLLLVGGLIPTTLHLCTACGKRVASRRLVPAAQPLRPAALATGQAFPTLLPKAVALPSGLCCSAEAASARSGAVSNGTSSSTPAGSSCSPATHRNEICARLPRGATAPCSHAAAGRGNVRGPLATMPVYHSRVTTRLVSVKVRKPAAKLEADPSPLVNGVQAALVSAPQPGTVILGVHHAVFRGCVQLVAWVRSVDQHIDPSAAGRAAEIQSAAEEAAWQLVGSGDGADSTVAMGPAVGSGMGTASGQGWCWVDWENGGDNLPGATEYHQFGSAQPAVVVRMAGEGLVGWVQANGGSVRVVVVWDEGGTVLADGKVQGRTGFWHGLELGAVGLSATILSFRVPIDLPTTASTTQVSSAHLLVLPVDETSGEVLWSTPLLLGLPPVVAAQLHQLHATMANYLLEDSSPASWSSAACDVQPAEALGQAYEQHIVPLLHDILVCCQPAHAAASQDDMAKQQLARQQVIDDVVGFFEGCGPSMSATLEWLHGCLQLQAAAAAPALLLPAAGSAADSSPCTTHPGPNTTPSAITNETGIFSPRASTSSSIHQEPPHPSPSSSTTTPAPPASTSTAPPPAANEPDPRGSPSPRTQPPREQPLSAVLLGSFRNPSTEARYQQYLTHSTVSVDFTIGPLQLLLLASTIYKYTLPNALIAGGHFLGTLALHLQLCGRSRSPGRRRATVLAMMVLVVLHILCYNLLAPVPEVVLDLWRQRPWIPICVFAVFHLAGQQAGFIQTTAFASIVALQLGHILSPHFGTWRLLVRTAPVALMATTVSFATDWAHRARFLATSPHSKHALPGR